MICQKRLVKLVGLILLFFQILIFLRHSTTIMPRFCHMWQPCSGDEISIWDMFMSNTFLFAPSNHFFHARLVLSSHHGRSTSRLDTRIPSRKPLCRTPTNDKEVVGFNTSANELCGHHEGVRTVFGGWLFVLHLVNIQIHVPKFALH